MNTQQTENQRPARGISVALLSCIGITLAVVVISPVALSSQDLVSWAESPTGLGLSGIWPYVVFVALDCAAALCIALTMHAAWKGQAGGSAHVLVWIFAGMSAFANWRYGTTSNARDAVWFFPAMSVAGATLLEVAIRRIRRWGRSEQGVFEPPLPRFRVLRWLIAYGETYRAWKLAVTEGITRPEDAIRAVRGNVVPSQSAVTLERSSDAPQDLSGISKADALRHAFKHLGSYDVPSAVDWLAEQGVTVHRSHAHNVAKSEKNIEIADSRPLVINGFDFGSVEELR